MFIGLTRLYIGKTLIGDIKTIKHEGSAYIFIMWDSDQVYHTDKLTGLDVLIGAGDRITIPE